MDEDVEMDATDCDAIGAPVVPKAELPPELLLCIIDLLGSEMSSDSDCSLALRNLSRTSRHLSLACHRHLFNNVTLDLSNIIRFVVCTSMNPSLLSHIQDLSVISELTTEEDDVREDAIVNVLGLLHRKNIKRFHCGYQPGRTKQRSGKMNVEFTMAVYWFLKRNDITQLSFDSIDDIYPPFFCCAPKLKSLCIKECSIDVDWDWDDEYEGVIKLEQLALDVTGMRIVPIIKCLDKRLVQSLRISSHKGGEAEDELLRDFICSLSRLEKLDVRIEDFDRESIVDILIPPRPDLSQANPLEFLRSLTLTVQVRYPDIFAPFAGLDEELAKISGNNRLEEIDLRLVFHDLDRVQLNLNPASWMGIEDSLRCRFDALRLISVSIELAHENDTEEDAEQLEEHIRTLVINSLRWTGDIRTLERVVSVVVPRPTRFEIREGLDMMEITE